MFNLSEQWKLAYEEYLNEQYDNFNSDFEDTLHQLEEAQLEAEKGLSLLQEYFEMCAELEKEQLSENNINVTINGEPAEKPNSDPDEKPAPAAKKYDSNQLIKSLVAAIKKDSTMDIGDLETYEPIAAIEKVERIGEMKFPQNIIFFIKQLVSWIAKVVVAIIAKFRNLIVTLLGGKNLKEVNPDALKLQLERVKKIEVLKPLNTSGKAGPTQLYQVDQSKIKPYTALTEGLFDGLFTNADVGTEKKPIIVTVDVSKDILSLKELVQHFYNLYDNAFGSNNERLFETEDLEVILTILNKSVKDLKSGHVEHYEINGGMGEISALDSGRVRENLLRTNQNITSLKSAYMDTSAKINDIAKIINQKELLMVTNMGADFKWLTSTTLEHMIEIMETIEPRLKEAKQLEKRLAKVERAYQQVSFKLQKLQQAFVTVGNVTYISPYQKRVADLFNASRYMTQTVSLRLTCLGLYIKELKDIKDIINMLAAVNTKKK